MDELWLLAALVLAFAVRPWAAELIRVKGKSMVPTLHNGDILGTTRFDYRTKPPQRQDVVICYYPGRYLRRSKHIRQCFVKRVIGLPGETVEQVIGHLKDIGAECVDATSSIVGTLPRPGV